MISGTWKKKHLTEKCHSWQKKLNKELWNKFVKCCVWSIALYDSETQKLRKLEGKYEQIFKVSCWNNNREDKRSEKVNNEADSKHNEDKEDASKQYPGRNVNWIGHILRRNCILHDASERHIKEV